MTADATYLKGVHVHVEDAGSALLVDVTLPHELTMSSVSLDLHEGVLRVVLPKSPDLESLAGHLINPDVSGV